MGLLLSGELFLDVSLLVSDQALAGYQGVGKAVLFRSANLINEPVKALPHISPHAAMNHLAPRRPFADPVCGPRGVDVDPEPALVQGRPHAVGVIVKIVGAPQKFILRPIPRRSSPLHSNPPIPRISRFWNGVKSSTCRERPTPLNCGVTPSVMLYRRQ